MALVSGPDLLQFKLLGFYILTRLHTAVETETVSADSTETQRSC